MTEIDWAFSPDGDLMSGDPVTDVDGNIIYKHMDGTESIELDENSVPIRDIHYISNQDAELQIIKNRLRTDSPDWYHHPNMGGNLTDLIGEPNTRETGNMGAMHIMNALTYDNLYESTEVKVRPVPVSSSEILFMIEVGKYGRDYRFPFMFSLEKGLLDYYEVLPEEIDRDDDGLDILDPVLPEEPTDGEEILPDVEEVDMDDLPEEYQYEEPDEAEMEDYEPEEEEDEEEEDEDFEGFETSEIRYEESYDSKYDEDDIE